jgi:hypothetical protein
MGQTKSTLMLLSFSPLHSGEPVQEVSTVLPMLDSVGSKMRKLREVIVGAHKTPISCANISNKCIK